ncbi:MAG: hypothetical protein ACOCWQ_00700 [Nanoarchaeota archaeon]
MQQYRLSTPQFSDPSSTACEFYSWSYLIERMTQINHFAWAAHYDVSPIHAQNIHYGANDASGLFFLPRGQNALSDAEPSRIARLEMTCGPYQIKAMRRWRPLRREKFALFLPSRLIELLKT